MAVVILAALALVGCGSSASAPHKQARKPACVILSNGNKLCDEDAITWCRENVQRSDTGSWDACQRVRLAVHPIRRSQVPSQCSAYPLESVQMRDCMDGYGP